ncbi:iron reductase domain protein, partial [Viridothelium virens]
SLLALAAGAFAQVATTYVDPLTDITFQAFTDNTTGYRFGIALPENPTTDFIAQLHAPLTNGSGWVGADLGAPMVNELLIVAWPSGNRVISSFREATAYASPPVYNGNLSVSMLPIAKGTTVTKNSMTYTFVCQGCITNTIASFSSSDSGTVFGWALSTDVVPNPSRSASALNFHSAGYGDYGVNLTMAKSAQYAQWAALANS